MVEAERMESSRPTKVSTGAYSNGTVASGSRDAASTTTMTTATNLPDGQQSVIEGHREGGGAIGGEKGGEELWSSILNSVQSSRATPVKNIIVLGEGQTGKSTLLARIAAFSPSGFVSASNDRGEDEAAAGDVSFSSGNGGAQTNGAPELVRNRTADLGLGYGYFDVGDDDGEDIIARVGVYQVSSTHPSNLSLLPFALQGGADSNNAPRSDTTLVNGKDTASHARTSKADALRECLFLITLDWEAPWTFLSQLIEWLDVIRQTVEEAAAAGDRQGAYVIDELKEDLEGYIRSYSEPAVTGDATATMSGAEEDGPGNTSVASAIVPVSGFDEGSRAPLPEGYLTNNLGVPIVIVCTKADTIAQLERQRNFKEEQFDYIQQVLRIVCLKYGAGLFFTAQSRPASFDVLREYLLHRLFASARHHSATGAFHFRHRASTVERDVLVVPAGWDSFGKIRALREGFDCASMASGWDWDTAVERIRRMRKLPKGAKEAEEAANEELTHDGSSVGSAVRLYEDIIEDWDVSVPHVNSNNTRVKEPDDQAFLLQHYNALQHDTEPRSRGAAKVAPGSLNDGEKLGKGVVGPLGSAGFSSSVERAMQERQSDDTRSTVAGASAKQPLVRRDSATPTSSAGRSATPTQAHANASVRANGQTSSGVQSPSNASRPTSPFAGGGSTSPSMSTPKQSEVLHSFFQSLLKEKPGSAPGSGSASRSSQPTARHGSGGGGGQK